MDKTLKHNISDHANASRAPKNQRFPGYKFSSKDENCYNISFAGSGAGSLIFAIEVYQKIIHHLLDIQSKYQVQFNFNHLGDTKNAPYGLKKPNEIKTLTKNLIKYLDHEPLSSDIIIIACNTASTAIDKEDLLSLNSTAKIIPIINDSAQYIYKKALEKNQTNPKILVLSTTATKNSAQYKNIINDLANKNVVFCEHDPQIWVKQIENGEKIDISQELEKIKTQFQNTDVIGLFCTHFPFLKKEITNYLKEELNISIDLISQSCIFTEKILESIENDKKNFKKRDSNSKSNITPQINSKITGDNLEEIKNIAFNIASKETFAKMVFSKTNIK